MKAKLKLVKFKEKESDIQRACLDYLLLQKDVFVWRNQSQGIYDPTRKVYRTIVGAGMRRGLPDIMGVYKPSGRFFGLEVKRLDGALSQEQFLMINAINEYGGYACVVRGIDGCERALKEIRGI